MKGPNLASGENYDKMRLPHSGTEHGTLSLCGVGTVTVSKDIFFPEGFLPFVRC